MIIDKLEKWGHYHFGSVGKRVFDFLGSLNPDAEEQKYELQGSDIFALVMSYETCTSETAVLETHRKYVDVQTVLIGGERIEMVSRDGLEVDTPYDESKDAEFYKRVPGLAHVDMYPGTFVLFFPHDAHMPGLMIGEKPELIKKVVVKIKVELLSSL